MSELKLTGREWHFELDVKPGDEVPDYKKRYGAASFRPVAANFTLAASHDAAPRFVRGRMWGPRINKGGVLGMVVGEELFSFNEMPGWLKQAIQRAALVAAADVNHAP